MSVFGCSPVAISRVAESIAEKSGLAASSTITGTTTTTESARVTASLVLVVASSRFCAQTLFSNSDKFASPGNGTWPLFTRSTTSLLMSQPMTSSPLDAIWTARGKPIFPSPTTQVVIGSPKWVVLAVMQI